MPDNQVVSTFHAALTQSFLSSALGPINSRALLRDKDLVLQKASSLHGYQTYLEQCRSWKAARKSVPRSFEREVQVHAAQALADGRDLATATLRSTRHLKQTGHLDRVLDSWIAGVKASGPVQVQDLWTDVAEDAQARQLLRDQGLSDDLFASIDENMQKLDGQIALHGGKLTGDVKLAGQERTQRIVLAHSASGQPHTLHDLLRRGQFEQLVQQFERDGAPDFDLVASPPHEVEIAELVATAAVFSVQSLAQHKRKLEDTGLATVAGQDPVTALVIVGLVLGVAGAIIAVSCGDNADQCGIGMMLMLFAALLVFSLAPGLIGPILGNKLILAFLLVAAVTAAKGMTNTSPPSL